MFLLFLLQQCLVQHIASEYKTFIKSIDQHVLNSCGVLVLYTGLYYPKVGCGPEWSVVWWPEKPLTLTST